MAWACKCGGGCELCVCSGLRYDGACDGSREYRADLTYGCAFRHLRTCTTGCELLGPSSECRFCLTMVVSDRRDCDDVEDMATGSVDLGAVLLVLVLCGLLRLFDTTGGDGEVTADAVGCDASVRPYFEPIGGTLTAVKGPIMVHGIDATGTGDDRRTSRDRVMPSLCADVRW